ncbi:hypothetical protein CR513_36782, partial [Mucuna pruriens]
MTIISPPTKKEQRFQDLRGMENRRQESKYEKVHNCKLSKKMWDILALAYEDNETIELICRRFQTIINNLRVSKDLKKLPMEELLGMLKVHEMELNGDEGQ